MLRFGSVWVGVGGGRGMAASSSRPLLTTIKVLGFGLRPLLMAPLSVSAHVDCAWDHWQRGMTVLPPTLSGRGRPGRFSVAEGVRANGNSLKDELGRWGAGIAVSC